MQAVVTCEGVRIGGAPTAEHLAELRAQGVKTLVDVREQDEGASPSAARLRAMAEPLGFVYRNIPISKRRVDIAQIDAFKLAIRDPNNAPVYAFSQTGRRPAGVLCFLYCAKMGDSVLEVFRKAKGYGLAIDKELALKQFILDFYSSHRGDMLNNYFRHHPV